MSVSITLPTDLEQFLQTHARCVGVPFVLSRSLASCETSSGSHAAKERNRVNRPHSFPLKKNITPIRLSASCPIPNAHFAPVPPKFASAASVHRERRSVSLPRRFHSTLPVNLTKIPCFNGIFLVCKP